MSLFLDRYNLELFIKIVKKICRLKELTNCDSIDNAAIMRMLKECVSDIDSNFTEMYRELILNPVTSVNEIKELNRLMDKHELN